MAMKQPALTHRQLQQRIVQGPDYKAMQAALKRLEKAPVQHRLSRFEKLAIVRNLRLVLAKSLPELRHPDPARRDRARRTLNIQLNLPRFRFLNQVPQARSILLRHLQGTRVRFEGIERELTPSPWLFETPLALSGNEPEGLFELEDLTREQMAAFLRAKWRQNPLLRQIARIQQLRGDEQHRALINLLTEFEKRTGVTVQIVPTGAVQRLRGQGNEASLRSRPGFLQIEQQVFQNTLKLLAEVRHELAFHYAGGPGKTPRLKNTIFNALNLLEMMIQGNGRLPPPVA